jgi:hypothetical protein
MQKKWINDLSIVYCGKDEHTPNETIHITPRCTMHFHGHQNKMVPLMKPFILVDFNNGIEFHNYTY